MQHRRTALAAAAGIVAALTVSGLSAAHADANAGVDSPPSRVLGIDNLMTSQAVARAGFAYTPTADSRGDAAHQMSPSLCLPRDIRTVTGSNAFFATWEKDGGPMWPITESVSSSLSDGPDPQLWRVLVGPLRSNDCVNDAGTRSTARLTSARKLPHGGRAEVYVVKAPAGSGSADRLEAVIALKDYTRVATLSVIHTKAFHPDIDVLIDDAAARLAR